MHTCYNRGVKEGVCRLKISVIGLGFVGLTAALGFADKGFDVSGYDIDNERSAIITRGEVPFYEPGLDLALERNLGGRFRVTTDASQSAKDADCVFVCVGTPCGDDGKADLTYLFAAIDSVVGVISPDCALIIKSTVPPGTTVQEIRPYAKAKGFSGVVAVNPEFLREGHCWADFTEPDRIVCGRDEGNASVDALFVELYEPFRAPIHFVSSNTAEFIKYMSNSLLATMVSFANEMALVAEAAGGIQIAKAFHILHQDNRLDGSGINHYIYPGCGYGGYCLPKDTVALAANARANGFTTRILDGVISLNDEMPRLTAAKIEALASGKDEKIGILGLSFKPNSDDVRDSSAAKIIQCLLDDGYTHIYAFDPVAMDGFRDVYGLPINYCQSKEELCETCDTLALVTIWPAFMEIDKAYPHKKICDCRYYLEG